uniref:Chitin-binding type-2 domain-containing protein n=1 Tax=Panagrolaimus davidi TaxID=227884 RepID=A0A914Q2Q1_9BILA
MHGDKRSQGCELCEGGDGYPYKYRCKNGVWEKVMCDNGTFCTEMGRCQAECQPCNSVLDNDFVLKIGV